MLARYPNLKIKQWNCMLLANRSCMSCCLFHIHNCSGPNEVILKHE